MPTAHNTIVSVPAKLSADLSAAAALKAEIARLTTDLKEVAARIVKASKVGDQYQIDAGKVTVTSRTSRTVDADVLAVTDPDLFDLVTETTVVISKWDAAAKLGKVSEDSAALVVETEGEPFLTYSLSTVR
jgi:hypothetical protein